MYRQWHLELASKISHFDASCSVLEWGSRGSNVSLRDALKLRIENWNIVSFEDAPGAFSSAIEPVQSKRFPQGSFDLIISNEVLEWCQDWRTHIRQLVHALKPGGQFFLIACSPGDGQCNNHNGYHRFSTYHFRRIFTPVGTIHSLESDRTSGWPCRVGIVVSKDAVGFDEEEWSRMLDDIDAVPAETSEHLAELRRSIFFDQYSRYACACDVVRVLSPDKGCILDVGGGHDCLLEKFLPQHAVTFIDPLLERRVDRTDRMLAGTLPDPRLAGKVFDVVTCIDVLEHMPQCSRVEFIASLCAHAAKGIVVMFPASDYGEALCTDAWVEKEFRKAYQRDNGWLHEHLQFGLPSLEATANEFTSLGFHVKVLPHGRADWLRDLLPIFLCQLEVPEKHQRLLEISEEFNTRFQPFDFAMPCYRVALVASREPIILPDAATGAVQPSDWKEFLSRARAAVYADNLAVYKDNMAVFSASNAERERILNEFLALGEEHAKLAGELQYKLSEVGLERKAREDIQKELLALGEEHAKLAGELQYKAGELELEQYAHSVAKREVESLRSMLEAEQRQHAQVRQELEHFLQSK